MHSVIQEFEKDLNPQVWECKLTPSYKKLFIHWGNYFIIVSCKVFFQPPSETAGNTGLDKSVFTEEIHMLP